MDQEVMALKKYSTLFGFPKPHHQIQFGVIFTTPHFRVVHSQEIRLTYSKPHKQDFDTFERTVS